MRTTVAIFATLFVVACTADASDPLQAVTSASAPIAAQETGPRPVDAPEGTGEAAVVRFVSAGQTVVDTRTGAVWLGTDAAGFAVGFDVSRTCSYLGYRPATTAEVQGLGAPLPPAFHVYEAYGEAAALPIVTFDGCVDLKTDREYAGECVIPGMPSVYRSTMCVK